MTTQETPELTFSHKHTKVSYTSNPLWKNPVTSWVPLISGKQENIHIKTGIKNILKHWEALRTNKEADDHKGLSNNQELGPAEQ